jgi:predicted nucleic acid-binding protein
VSLVLDASITLAWIYSDETTDAVVAVFERVSRTGAWVPGIWLEIANSLGQGIRKRRITFAFRDDTLSDLSNMRLVTDPDTDMFAWTATLDLADRFGLTLYDACYLELALRRGLPLATLDRDLRAAGQALGLTVFGACGS